MKHLVLTDSMSAILAFSKGRSSSGAMNRVCRQLSALLFATGMRFAVRWVPSELNPADAPSRGKPLESFDAALAARQWLIDAETGAQGRQGWRGRAFDEMQRFFTGGTEVAPSDSTPVPRGSGSKASACSGQGEEASKGGSSSQRGAEEAEDELSGEEQRFTGPTAQLPVGVRSLGELEGPERGTRRLSRRPRSLAGVPGAVPGRAVLGRSRSVRGLDSGGSGEVLQPQPPADEVLATAQQSHARLQETGTYSGESRGAVADAMCHPELDGATGQERRCSVGSPHMGSHVPPRRGAAPQMAACGGTISDEQVHGGDPKCLHARRRGFAAFQGGGVRRGAGGGPSLPPVAVQSSLGVQTKGSDKGVPHFRLQDTRGISVVQECMHESQIRGAGRGECLSDAARLGLNRLTGATPQPGGNHEARSMASAKLSEAIRQRRAVARSVQSSEPKHAKSLSQRREGDWRDVTGLKASNQESPIALEIFSGSGRMSQALRSSVKPWAQVYEIDIQHGPQFDLTSPRFQRFVRDLISSGRVVAVWIGTPCSSWSRARCHDNCGPGPLRSDTCLYGLPNLSAADRRKVQFGNSLMRFSASVAEICLQRHIPFCIENPYTSRIWLTRQFQSLRRSKHVDFCYTDFCGDNQAWRKRTGLLFGFVDLRHCCKQCHTYKGICSFSGHKHVQLVGHRQGILPHQTG